MDVGDRLGKDLMRPLVDNCKKKGIKFGLYFGTQEWEYPIIQDNGEIRMRYWFRRGVFMPSAPYTPAVEQMIPGKIPVKNFVKDYLIPQATEFIDKYDPDIMWYDGDWTTKCEDLGSFEISSYFYNQAEGRKEVAVCDRYGLDKNGKTYRGRLGDIFTSEHHSLSKDKMTGSHPWEENRAMGHTFSLNWIDTDETLMSPKELVDMFVGIVANGGNLLLMVCPDGNGEIPQIQIKRLKEIGKWLKVNGEGIYNTRAYSAPEEGDIRYTRSKDEKTVYAISLTFPGEELQLKSVAPAKDSKIFMLGYDKPLEWKHQDGVTTIRLPSDLQKAENRPCEYAYTFVIQQ
jgi:alpha-L-fucosidase